MRPILYIILIFTALAISRPVWQDALWPGTRGSADSCMDWRLFSNTCRHDLIIGMFPPDYENPIRLAPNERISFEDLRRITQEGEDLIYCRPPFRPASLLRDRINEAPVQGCFQPPETGR